jgi:hypothetical protein
MRCRAFCILVSGAFLAAGAFAAEQDFAKVAKALGLPEDARTEDVLKAIETLKGKTVAKAPEPSPAAKAEAAASQKAPGAVAGPTVGVSEKKGQWYGRAEALLLTRSIIGQGNLATFSRFDPDGISTPQNNGNEYEILGTRDIDFGYEPGMRLTLGYQYNDSTSLELTYFGLHNWEDVQHTPTFTAGNLSTRIPFIMSPPGGELRNDFFQANYQEFRYETWLHSAAFDVRYQAGKMGPILPTFTAGIRYLNIGEEFRFSSQDARPIVLEHKGTFDVDVENHLIGLQVGSEMTHAFNEWASLGVGIKGGILANCADQDTKMVNMARVPGPPRTDFTFNITKDGDSRVGLAGLVEAGVFTTFRPTKHIDVRLGYEALFVAGVAVAPNQNTAQGGLSDSPRARLNNSNSVLYHGPSLGLTFRW